MKRDVLIGGAWPYANYYMHIGHLAALLPGDVLARYFRGCGDNVLYVSGSDCHGTPITLRAKQEDTSPEKIATHYHEEFLKTFGNMNFSYDLYSATMSSDHKKYVQECFLKMLDNGYIFPKTAMQDYCENCKKFLSDREIVGTCPRCGGTSTGEQCDNCTANLSSDEVLDKHCKTCGNPTIMKEDTHLYFKLTAFHDELQDLIDKNKNRWRKNAIGEAQKYLDTGLVDRAATRQLDWGVPVPVSGYEDKRIYVWIEAVLGYLSVGYKVSTDRGDDFDRFMDDSNPNLLTYYVHGKDNIPFHTTIYPALIKSMKNNYRLPDYIISSAYVNLNDEKMSKSKGNLITVNELLEKFQSDTLRFYFIINNPELKDINCSIDDIIATHNKFLVGMLGNFVNRNLSFVNKKFDGVIKEGVVDSKIKDETKKLYEVAGNLIEKGEIRSAFNKIVEYISMGNKYYDESEPWIKVKDDDKTLFNNITYTCVYMMANIANLMNPVIPEACGKIKKMLGLGDYKWEEENLSGDIKINDLELLFERIED